MKISLLQLFALTAKHHNISLATKEATLSQAAASMSLVQALQILQKAKELEEFVAKPNQLSGHIHIGASTTIANYISPDIINLKLILTPRGYLKSL